MKRQEFAQWLMDVVYNYWHPEAAKKEDIIDGFHFDPLLVFIGLNERKSSGVEPNPYELAKRIHPLFHQDLNNLERILDQGKPAADSNGNMTDG